MDDLFATHDALAIAQLVKARKLEARQLLDGTVSRLRALNASLNAITDFYEGAPVDRLLSTAKKLLESGVTLLGLAALDERADPNYDRALAERLVAMGAHVAAMTPGELADWVAQKVR